MCDLPGQALTQAVDDLRAPLAAVFSLGDPIWHHRWEGEVQLVGLDCRDRSVADVRQRLARTVHEVALRHMAKRGRRMVLVGLCAPRDDEGLRGYYARLMDDQGEVGPDWSAMRRRIAVGLVDEHGKRALFGGDQSVQRVFREAGWSL